MRIVPFSSAAAFLEGTASLRAADPVLTNVIGSVAQGVVDGRRYESELWLGAYDDDTLVGCALRTAPWNLAISPMPTAAAHAIGAYVSDLDPELPGVTGTRAVVDAFVSGLTVPVEPHIVMVDLVRVLGDLLPPVRPVAGRCRMAVDGDVDLLVAWLGQFAADAGLPAQDPHGSVAAGMGDGGFWLWEVDGEPVAMAGRAPLVATPSGAVGRIGPVFTPAGQRRRGYGSAVTRCVAEALLPQCAIVMLYADAANPESNAVYERLGFRVVAEVVELALA